MTGEEGMEDVPEGFGPSQFSGEYLLRGGPYFTRKQGDNWAVALRVAEQHTNYIDIAHGGVLSTLADVALSLQPYRSEKPSPQVTTMSLTTNFLAPARLGDWLIAECVMDRLGKTSAYVHGEIRCEERLVATMSGVFNIFRPS
jgi:uncharacterized protein (TIGR00369 family)